MTFIQEMLAGADKIAADIKAGRMIAMHSGLVAREDAKRISKIDGGYVFPSHSNPNPAGQS